MQNDRAPNITLWGVEIAGEPRIAHAFYSIDDAEASVRLTYRSTAIKIERIGENGSVRLIVKAGPNHPTAVEGSELNYILLHPLHVWNEVIPL